MIEAAILQIQIGSAFRLRALTGVSSWIATHPA